MTSDTYSTILQVARRLFLSQGYTATSMRQVAEQAGIGKATIYHHFPDKQSIAMALVKDNVAQIHESLEIIGGEPDPRRRIEVAALVSLRFLYESADILQVVRREVPGARDYLRGNFVVFFKSFVSLLEDAFRKGIEQGIFRPVDPTETALVFMTLIQGNFAMLFVTGLRANSPEQAAERLLNVFFHGIEC